MIFNAGIVPIIVLSVATMCSTPSSTSITNSDMQYSYGIISQYDDLSGKLSASSQIPKNDLWAANNATSDESTYRTVEVTLNITTVSKYIPFFDFDEVHEEI